MKRLCIIVLALFLMLPGLADEGKLRIAVFDPISNSVSIDDGTKIAIREIISSTIVNTGKHDIVERSLLEKVMEEQQFSNSGVVNDNQVTEIGKLAGANKVVVSVVTLTGGRSMLSIKMIDVKTASVERQKVKVVTLEELINIVESMTLDLVEAESVDDKMLSVINTNEVTNSVSDAKNSLNEGEIVLYLPPCPQYGVAENLVVILDGNVVGEGTMEKGFNIRIMDIEQGNHKIKIKGEQGMIFGDIIPTSYKIDTRKEKYLNFKIRRIAGGKTTQTTSENSYMIILDKK